VCLPRWTQFLHEKTGPAWDDRRPGEPPIEGG